MVLVFQNLLICHLLISDSLSHVALWSAVRSSDWDLVVVQFNGKAVGCKTVKRVTQDPAGEVRKEKMKGGACS